MKGIKMAKKSKKKWKWSENEDLRYILIEVGYFKGHVVAFRIEKGKIKLILREGTDLDYLLRGRGVNPKKLVKAIQHMLVDRIAQSEDFFLVSGKET